MNTFVRKYEKNLIAVAMAFCMICGVLITPQMYKADSMIKDEGFTYTRTWFTNGNNEAWYDYNSSTVPSSHYKRWCFEFVKNGDLFKAGKSFSYNFNIDLSGVTLSSTTGRPSCTLVFTKVDFKDASYVTRYSTNGGELVRSSSGTSMFVYGGTHNIANYDIKYIQVYFYVTCGCQNCCLEAFNPSCLVEEVTVQDVIEEEIKVSNNILDNIKSMLINIANLPTNIANSLKNFFDNLPAYVETGNLALKSAFNSGFEALQDALPSGIKNALSGLFDGVKTAVNTVYDGVISVSYGVANLPSKLGGFFTNLGSTIGGFFADISGGLFELSSEDEKTLNGIENGLAEGKAPDELLEDFESVNSNVGSISNVGVDDFLEDEPISLARAVMGCIMQFEYIPQMLFISVSLCTVAFAFFGKR